MADYTTPEKDIEIYSDILILKKPLEVVLKRFGVEYKSFEGAVIDVETDEKPFLDQLRGIERYKNQSVVCCGFLDKNNIEIIAKTCNARNGLFIATVDKKLREISPPYYAFNVGCDMALLSKLLNRKILFSGELQQYELQKKKDLRQKLGIPNFDDPFNDDGFLAAKEWTKHLKTGEIDCIKKIILHNRACILKEYCILLYGGYRRIQLESYNLFFEGKNELTCRGDCLKLS